MPSNPTARVFNIQKYSIYDGPGIRTIVFFQGCPLSCLWCSNPEGQTARPQILLSRNLCTLCGACVKACPNSLHAIKGDPPCISSLTKAAPDAAPAWRPAPMTPSPSAAAK